MKATIPVFLILGGNSGVLHTRFTANVAIPRMAAPPTPRTNRAFDRRKLITMATPSSPFLRVLWKFIASFFTFSLTKVEYMNIMSQD